MQIWLVTQSYVPISLKQWNSFFTVSTIQICQGKVAQRHKQHTRRKIFTNYAPVNSQLPKKTLQMADILLPGCFIWNISVMKGFMEKSFLWIPSLFHWPSIEHFFRCQICMYNSVHLFSKCLWKILNSLCHRDFLKQCGQLYVHIWYLKHCSMLGQWNKLGGGREKISITSFNNKIFEVK